MDSKVADALKKKKQNYLDKKLSMQNQIKKHEKEYESLNAFKSMVMKSQEEFHTINKVKKDSLESLNEVKKNSNTAKKYSKGMNNIVSETGSKTTANVYKVLLNRIALKLSDCLNELNNCEEILISYDGEINKIAQQIKDISNKKTNNK